MAVSVIWESRFPPEHADEGLRVTKAIWEDMMDFEGYLEHEIVQDLDNSGYLIVISHWSSREAADEVLVRYSENPNALKANELVSEPRRRTVGRRLTV
ncbi:MAG: antibiotic biosynthesis monooxygenase [Rubrobacteraceae bacterium]